jgi:hypothetical protein
MASPGPALDPQQFSEAARTIVREVAENNRILLGLDALGAVDTIVREHMPRMQPRFQEGTLDFKGYERLVRIAAERAIKEFSKRNIRSVNDPEEVLRIVSLMLAVFPFDC